MTYIGFNDLVFRGPDVHSIDVLEPWTEDATPPQLDGVTVFVAVPERSNELDIVHQWFPDGIRGDTVDEDGTLLYTSFTVRPPL